MKVIIFLFLIGLGVGYFVFSSGGKTTDNYIGIPFGNSPTITCTFERDIEVRYEKNQIVHNTPHKLEFPFEVIFAGLDTDKPKLKLVGATHRDYEPELTILSNTPEKIVLVGDLTSTEESFFMYSIHRDKGVGTFTQQYNSFGTPFGTISMGKCSTN